MSQGSSQADPAPLKVRIAGMDCGSCAITIENSIRQLPGVADASVSFATESMEVSGTVNLQDTGQMLQGITPTRVQARRGELGFKGGGSLQKATWHQVTGAGRSRVIRRFFGITREDEDTAFKRVEAFIARRLS